MPEPNSGNVYGEVHDWSYGKVFYGHTIGTKRPRRAASYRTTLSIQHSAAGDPGPALVLPYITESLGTVAQFRDAGHRMLEGQSQRAGFRQFNDASGEVAAELPGGAGPWMRLFHHAIGGEVTTDFMGPLDQPRIHTIIGSDRHPFALSLEKQVGYGDDDPNDILHFPSVRVREFSIHAPRERLVRATARLIATREQHPAEPQHDDPMDAIVRPFNSGLGLMHLARDGSELEPSATIASFTLRIRNAINTNARTLASGADRARLPMGGRTITGEFIAFFTREQWAMYEDDYLPNRTVALNLRLLGEQPNSLEITIPAAKLRGSPKPIVTRPGPVETTFQFTAHRDSEIGTDIIASLTTPEDSIDGADVPT